MSLRLEGDPARGTLHIIPLAPPWIVPNSPSLPQDHPSYLCQNCRRYDFEWLFSHDLDDSYAKLQEENRSFLKETYGKFVVAVQEFKDTNNEENTGGKLDISKYKVVKTETIDEMISKVLDGLHPYYDDGTSGVDRLMPTPGITIWSHGWGFGVDCRLDGSQEDFCPEEAVRMVRKHMQEKGDLSERANWPLWFQNDMEDILLDTAHCSAEGGVSYSQKKRTPLSLKLCSMEDMLANQECAFCRLILQSILIDGTRVEDLSSNHARDDAEANRNQAADRASGCFIRNRDKGRSSKLGMFDIQITVFFGSLSQGLPKPNQVKFVSIQKIAETGNPFDGRLVGPQVSLENVITWLHSCPEQEASTMKSPPDGFRLIDLHRCCVVRIDYPCRYFALSYVWGGPQAFENRKESQVQLSQDNSLDLNGPRIPETIRNAMMLLSHVGERYLWVDSLCIIQDDANLKHHQILNMDVIYHQAFAVIVAAYGSDVHAGLPGVRAGSRRRTQHVEIVQGIKLANTRACPSILNTAYNSRSWTFQEILLARRVLVFGTNALWFRCERGLWEEDRVDGFTDQSLQNPSGTFRHLVEMGHQPSHALELNFQRYALLVKRYTHRRLSYDADALNAIAGILKVLRPSFRGEFIHGLPSTELDLALLWAPAGNLRWRTGNFPSWSWTAWDGPVTWHLPPTSADNWQYRVYSRVKWFDPCRATLFTSGQYRGSDAKKKTKWTRTSLGHFNEYFELSGLQSEAQDTDTLFLHATEKEENRIPRTIMDVKSGLLIIEARVALFTISHAYELNRCWKYSFKCSLASPLNCCAVPILDRDGFHAGYIRAPHFVYQFLLHPNRTAWAELESFTGLRVELLALSRTHGVFEDTPKNRDIALREAKYPPPTNDGDAISTKPLPLPTPRRPEESREAFDELRFRPKPWCVYNVMMILRSDDYTANRIGIGVCHVDAFQQARPLMHRVYLR